MEHLSEEGKGYSGRGRDIQLKEKLKIYLVTPLCKKEINDKKRKTYLPLNYLFIQSFSISLFEVLGRRNPNLGKSDSHRGRQSSAIRTVGRSGKFLRGDVSSPGPTSPTGQENGGSRKRGGGKSHQESPEKSGPIVKSMKKFKHYILCKNKGTLRTE